MPPGADLVHSRLNLVRSTAKDLVYSRSALRDLSQSRSDQEAGALQSAWEPECQSDPVRFLGNSDCC